MSISSSKTEKLSRKFRLVFLGDLSVGKSSIIERFTLNKFDEAVNVPASHNIVNHRNRFYTKRHLQKWASL